MKKNISYILLSIYMVLSSCTKIDISETDGTFLVRDQLLNSEQLRQALANKLYVDWHSVFNSNTFNVNIGSTLGLYADEFELVVANATTQPYNDNLFQPNANGFYGGNTPTNLFTNFFRISNVAGELLDIYEELPSLTDLEQHQRGEAHLFIAMAYHYAKVLYGELPIFTNPRDFNGNFTQARRPIELVNAHIATQAKLALEYLHDAKYDFNLNVTTGPARRLNRDAVHQFLSDFYLESGKPDSAVYFANLVTNKYPLETNLSNTFNVASSESIWVLQPMSSTWSTAGANLFNLINQPSLIASRPAVYSESFLDQVNDEDHRWAWIGNLVISGREVYFSTKYTTLTYNATPVDPAVMFRASKAHFNKAEALLQQNQVQQAYSAFLPLWNKNHSEPLEFADFNLDLVIKERWIEFATEHGDRWFTLRRYPEKLTEVMTVATAQKSQSTSQWEDYKKYFPIHQSIIQYSPYIRQNEGYVGY